MQGIPPGQPFVLVIVEIGANPKASRYDKPFFLMVVFPISYCDLISGGQTRSDELGAKACIRSD